WVPLTGETGSLLPWNQHLAERLFAEVRRHVEGTVYAALDAKLAAVQAFLEQLDADPARVRQLCGWDWLTGALDALPAPTEKAA
ncbi:MAG: hypothetical protein M3O34_02310, partial [Chloroflexota bacterium]|nr:hypothetical protein [Chloroflexota bacterium]